MCVVDRPGSLPLIGGQGPTQGSSTSSNSEQNSMQDTQVQSLAGFSYELECETATSM